MQSYRWREKERQKENVLSAGLLLDGHYAPGQGSPNLEAISFFQVTSTDGGAQPAWYSPRFISHITEELDQKCDASIESGNLNQYLTILILEFANAVNLSDTIWEVLCFIFISKHFIEIKIDAKKWMMNIEKWRFAFWEYSQETASLETHRDFTVPPTQIC